MPEDINKEPEAVNTEEVKPDPVAELAQKVKAMEDNWKREQQVNTKKELRIKELEAQLGDRDSDKELTKLLIASIASQQGVPEDEFAEKLAVSKPTLLAQYEEIEHKRKEQATRDAYNAKANAIWEDVKSLPDDNEDKKFVELALRAGDFDTATVRVSKLKETPKPVEKVKPSEEEIAEAARKQLEEAGQLTNDLPIPSGVGKAWSKEEIDNLKANAHTPAGLKKLNEALPEIEKATREGRLKI